MAGAVSAAPSAVPVHSARLTGHRSRELLWSRLPGFAAQADDTSAVAGVNLHRFFSFPFVQRRCY